MNRILIVGKASTISAQLAAIAPLFNNGGEKSRHQPARSALEAAGHPTPAADQQDIDHYDDGPWIDCWNCGGEGCVSHCFSEYACIDPDYGCDDCIRDCDICKGKGGWPAADHGERT